MGGTHGEYLLKFERFFAEQLVDSFYEFAGLFVEKYYTYDDESVADYHFIGSSDKDDMRCLPGPVCIAEEHYRSMENIWEALYHNIPKDKLMEWYEYRSDFNMGKGDSKEDPTNLVTRFLGEKEYTEEDRQESQERIKGIYDDLMKCAEENKSDEFKAKEENRKHEFLSISPSISVSVYNLKKLLQEYDREHLLD